MALIKEKLKSRNGASILLALLLLLLCVMVGSSIMAASMSNAGKSKGSQEAQQEYFIVKSAIELVCGELEKIEYTGQYEYSGKEFRCCDDPDIDHPLKTGHSKESRYVLLYKMLPEISPSTIFMPKTKLPYNFETALSKEFDKLYAVPFYKAGLSNFYSGSSPLSFDDLPELYNRIYTIDNTVQLKKDAGAVAEKQTDEHNFSIETNDDPLNGYKVNVKVEIIESDLSLKITAEIGGTGSNKGSNKMEALMTPAFKTFAAPTDSDTGIYEAPIMNDIRHPATSLTWTIKYIRKAVDK